jgi:hypothetical protein
MATPYFEEVQRLRDNGWIFVVIVVIALGSLGPLVYGLYWQVGQGVPWGNEPMTDVSLVMLTIFILVTVTLLGVMLGNLKLETRIDSEGIHYRMFPIKRKWRLIVPPLISEYSLEKKYRFFENAGIGFHRSLLRRTTSFRIWSRTHLSIKLHDGHRILLGTQNPEGMEWAMRKLMNKNIVR